MSFEYILPLGVLKGLVVFPGSSVGFDVASPYMTQSIERAMTDDKRIFLVTQKDLLKTKADMSNVYSVGCVAKVRQYAKITNSTARVMVDIIKRAEILEIEAHGAVMNAKICELEDEGEFDPILNKAFERTLRELFEGYMSVSKKGKQESHAIIFATKELSQIIDSICSNINVDFEIKQQILEERDLYQRAGRLASVLKNEFDIACVQNKINDEVRKKIDENQREYYLREEMKAIEKELGERDGFSGDIADYREKITSLKLVDVYKEKLLKETEKLSRMSTASPDSAVTRNYLDTVLELPWNEATEDCCDLQKAEQILENEHHGLEEVKERVLEHLAVHSLTAGNDGTVLCLVGPPGTGKTSVASSVANALGRKFVRISLGGVRDEADIRGHRKTYIGSMPGRIISAIKQSGVKNPVILLDEIDKMGNDGRSDPSAALLEVLDIEQNKEFRDHYIEIPFDLSEVMFIATANNLSNIPAPLADRIEIIEIPGYTNPEKFQIAKKYLIPKQIKKNGLKGKRINVTDEAITDIINFYTKEAGVRGLERKIAQLMRKIAKFILSGEKKSMRITSKNLCDYLGKRKYSYNLKNDSDEVGTVRGLAWTSVGGDTLSVEVNVMKGSGKVELTGNLGDVMKESAMTAVSYIRSKSDELKIKGDFYKTRDIHIHVPEGAVPKDGPSAGITIATAVASALTNTPVKCDIAMTGEITLRGNVLPIGGLREKSLAAYRAGITTVIIPNENEKDIDDIPEAVREKINFITAKTMDTVLENAFCAD